MFAALLVLLQWDRRSYGSYYNSKGRYTFDHVLTTIINTVSGKKCSLFEPKIAIRDTTPFITIPYIVLKRPSLNLISVNQVRRKKYTFFEKGEIVMFTRVNLNSNKIAKILKHYY